MRKHPKMHESEPAAFGLLAGLCVLLVAAVTLACGGGCAHYTRLDPQPRLMGHQFTTAVAVEALCINHDPFEDMTMPEIQGGKGSGVVIDARHVLTALHVVMCPYMADVHVVLADGKRIRMHVEKEWPDFDVARLVIASAGSFGPIAPPVLRKPTEGAVCAAVSWPTKAGQCGKIEQVVENECLADGRKWCRNLNLTMVVVSGNSGGPMYDSTGALVGLITGAQTQAGKSTGIAYGHSLPPDVMP